MKYVWTFLNYNTKVDNKIIILKPELRSLFLTGKMSARRLFEKSTEDADLQIQKVILISRWENLKAKKSLN